MASNITVSGLVVAPGVQQSYAQWTVDDPNVNGLPYLQLDRVELWAHTSNDRSGASKVAEGVTFANHVYTGLVPYYYWIRARDREGQYGDWYPSSSTAGLQAGGVWQTYTPTIEAGVGSFTTISSWGRYFRIGPNITFQIHLEIITNGSASNFITFTLPVDAYPSYTPVFGLSQLSPDVRAMCGVVARTGSSSVYLYDGSYPGGTGAILGWSSTYEADD